MFTFFSNKNLAFESLPIQQLDDLQQQYPNAILLDVRTAIEFDNGHIHKAINVDVKQQDFLSKITTLDPSKTYLVYCRSGVRSVKACQLLQEAGFEKIYNLKGGYLAFNK